MKTASPARLPVVNLALILLFAAIYLFGSEPGTLKNFSFSPSLFFDKVPLWRAVSYAFFHYDLFHLTVNSIFIYIFGNNLEAEIGHKHYFLLFISASAASVLFYAFFNSKSPVPIIGASGAISAIMAGYLYHFSDRKSLNFKPSLFVDNFSRIFVLLFIAIWFVIQYINSIMTFDYKTDTGWLVHIGGFIYGLLFSVLFDRQAKTD